MPVSFIFPKSKYSPQHPVLKRQISVRFIVILSSFYLAHPSARLSRQFPTKMFCAFVSYIFALCPTRLTPLARTVSLFGVNHDVSEAVRISQH
jgi:hypothetical protein